MPAAGVLQAPPPPQPYATAPPAGATAEHPAPQAPPGPGAGAEFFLSNYRLGKTLGIGSFGKVRKGGRWARAEERQRNEKRDGAGGASIFCGDARGATRTCLVSSLRLGEAYNMAHWHVYRSLAETRRPSRQAAAEESIETPARSSTLSTSPLLSIFRSRSRSTSSPAIKSPSRS